MKSKLHLNLPNLLKAAQHSEPGTDQWCAYAKDLETLLRAAVRVMDPRARSAFWESPEVRELLED
jgi:hypothetical protein